MTQNILMQRVALMAGLFALAMAGLNLPLGAAADGFAIANARIVDGAGREPFLGTVIVEGNRITAVGPDVAAPAGKRVIDAAGLTLVPGLFDLHVHLFGRPTGPLAPDLGKNLAAYLYCGVTSIVDLGSNPASFAGLRELVASKPLAAPRVSLAARVATPGGHGSDSGLSALHTPLVATPAEAREAIRRAAAFRPDLIKALADGWRDGTAADMASMDPATLAALTDEARRYGLSTFSHTLTAHGIKVAAEAGVSTLAHGASDVVVDPALASGLRERNMTYVPTLGAYEPPDRRRVKGLLTDVLEPQARAWFESAVVQQSASTGTNGQRAEWNARRWKAAVGNVLRMREVGVRLGVGTDSGVEGQPHGWSTLHEIALLVEAGVTPLEAFTAATGYSAWSLGVHGDRGFIQPGRRADLVLIAGDPLKNIADIERIERVFFDGREVDRASLRAGIAADGPTPMASVPMPAPALDDFEGDEGRSDRGSLWIETAERGPEPTTVQAVRVARAGGGHALRVTAEFSDAERPVARVTLPLVDGGLRPVDTSRYRGLRFEARGDGRYQVRLETRRVRDGRFHESSFLAATKWIPVAIHFTSASQAPGGPRAPWDGRDLTAITFEIARDPGTEGWLELDNLRLY
jgi:imidazolonepropionase-like amidohydrolase